MSRCSSVLGTIALWFLVSGPIAAGNFNVTATGNNTFVPKDLTIDVGDSVTFVNGGGFHNVQSNDGGFRCAEGCDGQGGDGDPSSAPWSFTLTFDQVGLINYVCEAHVGLGMVGSILVEPSGGGGGGATILARSGWAVPP